MTSRNFGRCQTGPTIRLPAIEGLRGLAMTLVFFGHFEALFRSYLPAGGVRPGSSNSSE